MKEPQVSCPGLFLSLVMMCSPAGHLIDDRVEILAARRESVLGTRRDFRIDLLPDDAMLGELLEPGCKRARADALKRAEEFAPALRSGEEIADHKDGPLLPDDIERGFDRTGYCFLPLFRHRL